MSLRRTFQRLLRDREGATVVEYAVLCALIFFAVMVTVQGMASETNQMWSRVNSTLSRSTAA